MSGGYELSDARYEELKAIIFPHLRYEILAPDLRKLVPEITRSNLGRFLRDAQARNEVRGFVKRIGNAKFATWYCIGSWKPEPPPNLFLLMNPHLAASVKRLQQTAKTSVVNKPTALPITDRDYKKAVEKRTKAKK